MLARRALLFLLVCVFVSGAAAQTLLEQAVSLTMANDNFGSGRFTAEAYYDLVRFKESQSMPVADDELCAIVNNHDPQDVTQRARNQFANDRLGDVRCLP